MRHLWKQYRYTLISSCKKTLCMASREIERCCVLEQVLAFYSADPHYWPPRIRVLDSDLTLNELHSGVEAWALQHPLEHCQDLATNLTIFDGNATTSYSGGHGFVHTNLTALDEAHAAAMHTCRAELDTASPKAAKLVTDFLLHVFDRNGWVYLGIFSNPQQVTSTPPADWMRIPRRTTSSISETWSRLYHILAVLIVTNNRALQRVDARQSGYKIC